jgi:hypothetical protein
MYMSNKKKKKKYEYLLELLRAGKTKETIYD